MSEVLGRCDERFADVGESFASNLGSGEELGASLVVDIDGERPVDLWGGYCDPDRIVAWDESTITNVWSTTKTVTALATLMLVDRGQLDVHAPVADYWPEFAAEGKERVEVRHLLSHSSGVSGLDQPASLTDLFDARGAAERMASQAPWWEPGTASGYHALNYGHLLGEVIRRVSGGTLKEFVAEEIAGPLGADFQIGADEADWPRIADVVPPPPADLDLDSIDHASVVYRTLTGPAVAGEDANTSAWRRAEMGATNGHGNARSLADIGAVIARGGASAGVRLLGPDTIDLIFEEQVNGMDHVLGMPMRWGIGYALPRRDVLPWIPEGRICFWGGWGGSMLIMDIDRRMTISYMMNKMGAGVLGSDRSIEYVNAIYGALG